MIVVDVETTGLDPNKNSLLSIGAIDFQKPERSFYEECRVWEGAQIEEDALTVNGFTKEEVIDPQKKTEADIVTSFLHWAEQAEDHTLAGQNPFFDLSFIKSASYRAGADFFLASRTIDLHTVCFTHMIRRKIIPPREKGRTALNSDAIMKYVGIPTEPKPHVGINGAIWETEAFNRLLYNENLLPQFREYPIPWTA